MAQQAGLSLMGKGFFGSLCVGTFGLGVWQTQRYFEKEELVTQRQEALSQPPLDHYSTSSPFRRMRLEGQFLYEKECLVGPRGPPPGALPDKPGFSGGGMGRAPQGYFIISPLEVKTNPQDKEEAKIVLVNRGWVPRYLVYDEKIKPIPGRPRAPPTFLPPTWERPNGTVAVTCVASQGEQPRFLVADHKLNQKLPELFWMDVKTLQNHVDPSLRDQDPAADPLPLVTAVQEDDEIRESFPLPPPAQNVGDFKTSPSVHAGYAVTWYGLAAAGLYMTRVLILRR